MGSSCCMDGCLLSLPAACPGISKGFYQACIMSPSPTPMQMAKLPRGPTQLLSIASKGKEMASFRHLGMARDLGDSGYWITPEFSIGRPA